MDLKFHIEFLVSLFIVIFSKIMYKIISVDNITAQVIVAVCVFIYCITIVADGICRYRKNKNSKLHIIMPIIYSLWVVTMFGMEYYMHYILPPPHLVINM